MHTPACVSKKKPGELKPNTIEAISFNGYDMLMMKPRTLHKKSMSSLFPIRLVRMNLDLFFPLKKGIHIF